MPDAQKGERLVVLHTGLSKPPEEICRALADAGNPPIWIPSPDSFCQVDEIPVLGTGKLAVAEVQDLARRSSARSSDRLRVWLGWASLCSDGSTTTRSGANGKPTYSNSH